MFAFKNKVFTVKFWLTQHFTPKSAKFQNWYPFRGLSTTQWHNIFIWKYEYIYIYIYILWLKKLNGFLMGKIWFFKKIRSKISKILKFCSRREIFSIFWYIEASKLKFSVHVLYWKHYRKTKKQTIMG